VDHEFYRIAVFLAQFGPKTAEKAVRLLLDSTLRIVEFLTKFYGKERNSPTNKDYANQPRRESMTQQSSESIRRFLMHMLQCVTPWKLA
jgi:plasmid stabilization system protein ParE